MRLFLVRHGEAKSKLDDPSRSLTREGIQDVEKVAAWMAKLTLGVTEIQHSGKRRSEQTAAIFASHLAPPRGVAAASGLNPNDDVRPIADKLDGVQDSLMIVGHLPFLSRLASLLVANDPECDAVRFQNAGVVCLVRDNGLWSIEWIVVPDLLV